MPVTKISIGLSYSFPHTSHFFMFIPFSRDLFAAAVTLRIKPPLGYPAISSGGRVFDFLASLRPSDLVRRLQLPLQPTFLQKFVRLTPRQSAPDARSISAQVPSAPLPLTLPRGSAPEPVPLLQSIHAAPVGGQSRGPGPAGGRSAEQVRRRADAPSPR